MSYILAVDTSTRACSAAILKDDEILIQAYSNYKLKHSDKLLPMIKSLFDGVGLSLKDIDYFALGCGPGSYTGLRVSAAVIKAFAQVGSKKIVSVSSLKAVAMKNEAKVICVIFDAQGDYVYCNIYIKEDNDIKAVFDKDVYISLDDLVSKLKEYDNVLFAGDALYKHSKYILSKVKNCKLAKNYNLLPDAAFIGYLALKNIKENKDIYSYETYLPNYIREFEVKLKKNE